MLLRDLFLGGLALAILYDQVLVAHAAQPILIGLVIFLFGSIKALRGDDRPHEVSTFARLVMAMLGVELPSSYKDNEEGHGPSAPDVHTSSRGEPPAESGRDSHKH
jgi:hypothetical protein